MWCGVCEQAMISSDGECVWESGVIMSGHGLNVSTMEMNAERTVVVVNACVVTYCWLLTFSGLALNATSFLPALSRSTSPA